MILSFGLIPGISHSELIQTAFKAETSNSHDESVGAQANRAQDN